MSGKTSCRNCGCDALPVSAETSALLTTLRELAAIQATAEDAATRILESAEVLLAKDDSAEAQEALMSIMTACSFHDLVGQRVTKITEILNRVIAAGLEDEPTAAAQDPRHSKPAFGISLAGPAFPGSDAGQASVDAVFCEES